MGSIAPPDDAFALNSGSPSGRDGSEPAATAESSGSGNAEAIGVARDRVIVEVTLHDRFEPVSGFAHGFVHALTELLLNFRQLYPSSS